LFLLGFLFIDRLYTSVSFISTALVCLLLKFIFKISWFGKSVSVYTFLLLPFFIVNGVLTGTGLEQPVVSYNNAENLGIRLLSIPVEDVFYGYELILLNLFFYHLFKNRSVMTDQDKRYNIDERNGDPKTKNKTLTASKAGY
ncbi:MAG TPA: lycopene cyclase domain-containing protein, partial [Flavisolibacter sp.]|nr:lycopene cyclase domain-containing protein [Flavisolibacter sp.]